VSLLQQAPSDPNSTDASLEDNIKHFEDQFEEMVAKQVIFICLPIENHIHSELIYVFVPRTRTSMVHSFIHSGYFYSASSSLLLFRGAPNKSIDTVSELTRRSATSN